MALKRILRIPFADEAFRESRCTVEGSGSWSSMQRWRTRLHTVQLHRDAGKHNRSKRKTGAVLMSEGRRGCTAVMQRRLPGDEHLHMFSRDVAELDSAPVRVRRTITRRSSVVLDDTSSPRYILTRVPCSRQRLWAASCWGNGAAACRRAHRDETLRSSRLFLSGVLFPASLGIVGGLG